MTIDSMIHHIGADNFVDFFYQLSSWEENECTDYIFSNIRGEMHDARRITRLGKKIFKDGLQFDILDAIIQKRLVSDEVKEAAENLLREEKRKQAEKEALLAEEV